MPDTSVKLQDITPVKSTFDSNDQLLLINPTGEARINKEDFLDAMPDDAITLIGDITTTGIEGDTVAKQLVALENSKAPVITETTESSAIANFTDGADDMVMHHVVAEINPVQSGSGDPSPSNIRPISGWTGCNVTRSGTNLANLLEIGTFTESKAAGSTYESMKTANTTRLRSPALIPIYGKQITVSWSNYSNYGICFTYFDSDGLYLGQSTGFQSWRWAKTTINNSAIYYIACAVRRSDNGTMTESDISALHLQVEFGSTATAYEEYVEPITVSVDWTSEAGTVYGGTIDVATGLLTVTHQSFVWDGVTYPFTVQNNVFVNNKGGIKQKDASSTSNKIILKCDRFKPNGVGYRSECTDGTIIKVRGANNQIACYSSSFASVSDFNASLAQNPMTMVYELATPVTYQLTPQQLIKTLLGTNNVWADTGDTSVTYAADTKMFIEKLTMPTEDDLVANQAITSGKYFIIGNSLYLALANIANGAQITIGTNAQRVSLADALNAINT